MSELHLATTTEVLLNGNTFSIFSFYDLSEICGGGDLEEVPNTFSANLLDEPTMIDLISGIEGELLMNYRFGSSIAYQVDINGNLLLTDPGDNELRYSISSEGYLIYDNCA